MAYGGKLVAGLATTALWLPAVEGAIAAGEGEIATPTQLTPDELWPIPDFWLCRGTCR